MKKIFQIGCVALAFSLGFLLCLYVNKRREDDKMDKAIRDMLMLEIVLNHSDDSVNESLYDLAIEANNKAIISIEHSKLNASNGRILSPFGSEYKVIQLEGKPVVSMDYHGGCFILCNRENLKECQKSKKRTTQP